VPRFHEEVREHLRADGDVLPSIRESGDLSDETEEKLKAELERFLHGFNIEEEKGLAG